MTDVKKTEVTDLSNDVVSNGADDALVSDAGDLNSDDLSTISGGVAGEGTDGNCGIQISF